MKREAIINLNRTLQSLVSLKGNIKFSYGVHRNIKLIKDEVDTLLSLIKPYDDEKIDIIKEHIEKNEKGEYKSKDGRPVFKDETVLEDKLHKLENKYTSTLNEYSKLLKEKVDIELYKISIVDLEDIYLEKEGKELKVNFSARDLEALDLIIKE